VDDQEEEDTGAWKSLKLSREKMDVFVDNHCDSTVVDRVSESLPMTANGNSQVSATST